MRSDGLGQQLVKLRGRNALLALIDDLQRIFERYLDVSASLRGDEMVPHPRREVELTGDLGLDLSGHLLATVYHVPLVHRQHQADRSLERIPGYVRVLRGDTLGPVREEDGHVRALERVRRSQ